jgi:hypothetical protein
VSWVDDRERYQALARRFDPAVRLVVKEGWFWTALAWILCIVTFGGIRPRSFLRDYATTIGPIQAYPRAWTSLDTRLLVHEARHVRQCRACGAMIHPWVGLPIYFLLYILLPLPLGLAWFRYWFELDADRASWRWWLQEGGAAAEMVRLRAQTFAEKVGSSSYGWPWPRAWVAKGFLGAAETMIEEVKRAG